MYLILRVRVVPYLKMEMTTIMTAMAMNKLPLQMKLPRTNERIYY